MRPYRVMNDRLAKLYREWEKIEGRTATKVIFEEGALAVAWDDGTYSVVEPTLEYDPEECYPHVDLEEGPRKVPCVTTPIVIGIISQKEGTAAREDYILEREEAFPTNPTAGF